MHENNNTARIKQKIHNAKFAKSLFQEKNKIIKNTPGY
jgi:hypothetical protein